MRLPGADELATMTQGPERTEVSNERVMVEIKHLYECCWGRQAGALATTTLRCCMCWNADGSSYLHTRA